ncbi:oxidoreductase-like protein [Xylariaceae sp. AK1471]|nr:oxidoreductase-like protein [Xylariaceae sp. AK1471]
MPPNMRPLMRVARIQSLFPRNSQIQRAFASSGTGTLPGGTPGESGSSDQAMPLGPYYESILHKPQPIPEAKPEEPPTSSPKSPRSTTKKAATQKAGKPTTSSSSSSASSSGTTISSSTTRIPRPSAEPATAQEKARIIFGSRLAGPAERADRLQAIRDRSTLVGGVLVPPRPEEPDNCCMGGCANCVWDTYRDDMETWAAASTRAEEALQQAEESKPQKPADVIRGVSGRHMPSPSMAVSMDDDGGGSETNWRTEEMRKKTDRPKIAKDFWDDDLYKNVPVGIREFIKQEKKLKKKHEREGTFGA